jgi:RecB family exonuclease
MQRHQSGGCCGGSTRTRSWRARATSRSSSSAGARDGQLALFAAEGPAPLPRAPILPALHPLEDPAHHVRTLSFTALATFERCAYRYYAERIVGMRPREEARKLAGGGSLDAVDIGSIVHALLERLDLRAPRVPADLAERVRRRAPASAEEVERIGAFLASYCTSPLAERLATLDAPAQELAFAFEHDGVLLHGYLDVFHEVDGRALVVDYKTNALAESSPEEIVEHEYSLQRLVYALACFRAGAEQVEVVYHFLEQPDATVATLFERDRLPELEAELSAAIARLATADFRPSPSESICFDCPALDVVCAGPRLRGATAGAGGAAGARA